MYEKLPAVPDFVSANCAVTVPREVYGFWFQSRPARARKSPEFVQDALNALLVP
jgi:hypothetical protein